MDYCQILIIDDDEDDVQILSEALIKCGVDRIKYVFSAMEAFMYLQSVETKELPELIVTDHYLPKITGLEFLNDLKGMDRYKQIPVIVLANLRSEAEIEMYRRLGAIDHLTKPTSYDEYVELARVIVEKIK